MECIVFNDTSMILKYIVMTYKILFNYYNQIINTKKPDIELLPVNHDK